MRTQVVSVGPLTSASANNIATSQSVSGATAVTLNGATVSSGVATLDHARRVGITSAGNDSGITFTLTGTDWAGNAVSEVLAGANAGVATSILDYLTISSIVTSNSTASTITVGTTAVAGSPWVRFDEYSFGPAGVQFSVSGTVNYTLQTTFDDPNGIDYNTAIARTAVVWDTSYSVIINQTVTQSATLTTVPRYARVIMNSGSGTVTASFTQYAVAPR